MPKMRPEAQKALWERMRKDKNLQPGIGPEEQPRMRGVSDETHARITGRGINQPKKRLGPRKRWLRPI